MKEKKNYLKNLPISAYETGRDTVDNPVLLQAPASSCLEVMSRGFTTPGGGGGKTGVLMWRTLDKTVSAYIDKIIQFHTQTQTIVWAEYLNIIKNELMIYVEMLCKLYNTVKNALFIFTDLISSP